MTITIKYLSHENKLTPVDRLDDIPDIAQFVWCDLN